MRAARSQFLPPRGRWPEGPEGVSAAESATADIPDAGEETPSVASRQLPLKGSIYP
jgi:hypothetical protein